MLRTISYLLLFMCSITQALALNMNIQTDEQEKLAYVNLWGDIQFGDGEKFRSIVLPYIKAGYLIFEVNIFSNGGNVAAAMGIGEQIKTLQTRTVTAYEEAIIVNNRKVATGRTSCTFKESKQGYIQINNIVGAPYCNCASACFLIWASGAVREGGHVGIHRFSWDAREFSNLSVAEARARYQAAQAAYNEFLKKLDVPQTILDRLYATDSRSMYYLTWPEHQLMQSTPYVEELTLARCGPDRTEHMSARNKWTMTQDIEHVKCYRQILKELFREGARNYQAKYNR